MFYVYCRQGQNENAVLTAHMEVKIVKSQNCDTAGNCKACVFATNMCSLLASQSGPWFSRGTQWGGPHGP